MSQKQKNKPIYTVTVIRDICIGIINYDFVNFFFNTTKAEKFLAANKEFLIDNNYQYAVIEEVFEGKLSEAKVIQWYRFKQNYTLKIEKSSVSLKKVKTPEQYKNLYAFCGQGMI